MKKGIVLDELPPTQRRRDEYDWDTKAKLAKDNPGKVVLAYKDVPISRIMSLRQRKRPPFIESDGRIQISMRDSFINDADGKRYGDVYFSWAPAQESGDK